MSIELTRWIVRVLAAIVLCSLAFDGCTRVNKFFGLNDDNIFEEAIEVEIERRTGIDIDLTP